MELGNYGRFGNQLWQVASTIGIAKRNNTGYGIPAWWKYHSLFNNRLVVNFNFNGLHVYNEEFTGYKDIVLANEFNWDLRGYFQSYKYFQEYEYYIRMVFSFDQINAGANTCAIHIRRGDYVALSHIHVNLPYEYYRDAIKQFPSRTEFLIFTDDVEWVRDNWYRDFINLAPASTFTLMTLPDEVLSFRIMSSCSHQIIANSSYSWWAAWLNTNKNKVVISPDIWVTNEPHEVMDDRIPEGWLRL